MLLRKASNPEVDSTTTIAGVNAQFTCRCINTISKDNPTTVKAQKKYGEDCSISNPRTSNPMIIKYRKRPKVKQIRDWMSRETREVSNRGKNECTSERIDGMSFTERPKKPRWTLKEIDPMARSERRRTRTA